MSLRAVHSWLRGHPGPIAFAAGPGRVDDPSIRLILGAHPELHEIVECLNLGASRIGFLPEVPPALEPLTQLLDAAGLGSLLGPAAGEHAPQEIIEADHVPHGRREVFGLGGGRELPDEGVEPRIRLREAVRELLSTHGVDYALLAEVDGPGLALVASGCVACGVCEKACPTGALTIRRLPSGPGRAIVTLAEVDASCIACEACIDLCPVEALSAPTPTSWEQALGEERARPLASVPVRECERCKAPVPLREGKTLCPTCEAQRANPFGVRWPEGVPKPPGVSF